MEYLFYVHSLKYAVLKAKYVKFCDDTVFVYSATTEREVEEIVNQYGFQKKSSTLGATVDLVEHITSELDQNRS